MYRPEKEPRWTFEFLIFAAALVVFLLICASGLHAKNDDAAFEVRLEKEIKSLIGTPYRWGGKSSRGVDCSGAIYLLWKRAGRPIPRMTSRKLHAVFGKKGHWKDAKKGDLIFWTIDSHRPYGHVGIYAGNGEFWQAGSSTGFVKRKFIPGGYWDKYYAGTGRVKL